MVSSKYHEPVVISSTPMPHGYIFIRKGNVYITKNCRKLTHEAGAPVYVVHDSRKTTQGIRVPARIWHRVRALNAETKASRAKAVQKKDEELEGKVRVELVTLFPDVPEDSVGPILKHMLKKRSGRVGRARDVPLRHMVPLAVRAHIRHCLTKYDGLLKEGMGREEARRRVNESVEEMVRKWGGRIWSRSPEADGTKCGRSKRGEKERNRANRQGKEQKNTKVKLAKLKLKSTVEAKGRRGSNTLPRRYRSRFEEKEKQDDDDDSDPDWDPMDLD